MGGALSSTSPPLSSDNFAILGETVHQRRIPIVEVAAKVLEEQQWQRISLPVSEATAAHMAANEEG